MKVKKFLYLIVGALFILLNLITDILSLSEYKSNDAYYNIGYFIGSHILFLVGIIFLRLAYKINKKLKSKDNSLEEAIEKIGTE
jgi:uncharacterized membrane protein